MTRAGTRPRSACSVARASAACGIRVERWGGDPAEAGDDGLVNAGDADGGVGEIDDGVSGVVKGVEGRADGDGLSSADLAGDHAEAAFPDAPGDAGCGLGVGGVPVQHPGARSLPKGMTEKP